MKKDLLKLLEIHRTEQLGIYIPQDLEEYVDKLIRFARLVLIYEAGDLQGFIGYYQNDPEKKHAFLSMLLVGEKAQGKGLGKDLLNGAVLDLQRSGFETFGLEVSKQNQRALKIYQQSGFQIIQEKEKVWEMEMKLP